MPGRKRQSLKQLQKIKSSELECLLSRSQPSFNEMTRRILAGHFMWNAICGQILEEEPSTDLDDAVIDPSWHTGNFAEGRAIEYRRGRTKVG